MEKQLYTIDISIPQSWEDFSSENLYWLLAHRRETFDEDIVNECFKILSKRFVGLYIKSSQKFWKELGWTYDDACMDEMEYLWELIFRKTLHYAPKDDFREGVICAYVMRGFRWRASHHFRDIAKKYPVTKGDIIIGFHEDSSPEFAILKEFNTEFIQKNREASRRSNAKQKAKKEAAKKVMEESA